LRRTQIAFCLVGLMLAACNAASTGSSTGPGQQTSTAPSTQQSVAPANTAQSTSAAPTLRTVRDIPLQGNTSRFDYQSFDSQSHRLYIAHLGDGTATVYDTRSGAVVGEIRDVPGVHGVIAVPDVGKVYATATDKNQVAVIDPDSLAVIGRTDAGDYPDGLAYDPDVGKIYVSDEHGGTDTVIDTKTNQSTGKIQLGGDVGNTQYDPTFHRMLVAVGSSNKLVAIDPTTDKVSGSYDVPGCQGAHGVAIDADQGRVFVACEGNAKLVALDLQSMQVVFSGDVGKTPDVLAIDPALHRIYIAAESGPLTVLDDTGGTVRELLKTDAGPNAHTVAVDTETHHIYLPLQNLNGHPVLREMVVEGAP
jgi:YVTN family beta-propeller protein